MSAADLKREGARLKTALADLTLILKDAAEAVGISAISHRPVNMPAAKAEAV